VQRTGSILVVDNDAAIVNLIVDVLTEEGYVAYSAVDGAHALAVIARHLPALILLDMWMPDLSGADLIARVRRSGLATMPIVLMTTVPQEVAPLLVTGVITCLAKPFILDDLLACVARYVRPVYSPEVVGGALRGLSGRGRAG
jgi:DNA-binding response OmpR family regulator